MFTECLLGAGPYDAFNLLDHVLLWPSEPFLGVHASLCAPGEGLYLCVCLIIIGIMMKIQLFSF